MVCGDDYETSCFGAEKKLIRNVFNCDNCTLLLKKTGCGGRRRVSTSLPTKITLIIIIKSFVFNHVRLSNSRHKLQGRDFIS